MSDESQPEDSIEVGALSGQNTWDLVRVSLDGAGVVQGRLVSVRHTHKKGTELLLSFDQNNEIPVVLHRDVRIDIVKRWRTQ